MSSSRYPSNYSMSRRGRTFDNPHPPQPLRGTRIRSLGPGKLYVAYFGNRKVIISRPASCPQGDVGIFDPTKWDRNPSTWIWLSDKDEDRIAPMMDGRVMVEGVFYEAPKFCRIVRTPEQRFFTPQDQVFASRQLRIESLPPLAQKAQDDWARNQCDKLKLCSNVHPWLRKYAGHQGGYICPGRGHWVSDNFLASGQMFDRENLPEWLDSDPDREGGLVTFLGPKATNLWGRKYY